MADRPLEQLDTMVQENIGHTCIYTIDEEDRNFKYCIYCQRVVYRTDAEILLHYTDDDKRKK